MDNYQIDKLLNSYTPTKKQFLGVYPADQFPLIHFYPCSFISNTDPSNLEGKHWVAFYVNSPSHIEYFDSYGKFPNNYHKKFLKQFLSVKMNNFSLQSKHSIDCGAYCIYFIVQKSKKKTFGEIITKLKSVPNSDWYVREFLSKTFCN